MGHMDHNYAYLSWKPDTGRRRDPVNSAAATGAWQINCQVVRTLRGGANLPRQTSIRPGKPSAVDEARAVRRDAGVPLRAGTAFRPVQQDDDDGGHSDSSWPGLPVRHSVREDMRDW